MSWKRGAKELSVLMPPASPFSSPARSSLNWAQSSSIPVPAGKYRRLPLGQPWRNDQMAPQRSTYQPPFRLLFLGCYNLPLRPREPGEIDRGSPSQCPMLLVKQDNLPKAQRRSRLSYPGTHKKGAPVRGLGWQACSYRSVRISCPTALTINPIKGEECRGFLSQDRNQAALKGRKSSYSGLYLSSLSWALLSLPPRELYQKKKNRSKGTL